MKQDRETLWLDMCMYLFYPFVSIGAECNKRLTLEWIETSLNSEYFIS